MKTKRLVPVLFAALLCRGFAQQLPTTGSVESRLGKLELENGYPTSETAKKIYDDIDFQRACQAYLWALPLMAMHQWQQEHHDKFGAGNLDYVDMLIHLMQVDGFRKSCECQDRHSRRGCVNSGKGFRVT